jgi:hypothetical protein
MSWMDPDLLHAYEAILTRQPGALAVFADLLLERGVAHGELMGLRATGGTARKRMDRLGRRGQLDAFFAPMLDHVLHGNLRGGLPDAVTLAHDAAGGDFDSAFWGTVRHVDFTEARLSRFGLYQAVTRGTGWRWLESVAVDLGTELLDLAELGWKDLRAVRVNHIHPVAVHSLADSTQWPCLQRATLLRTPTPATLEGLYARGLEELTLSSPWRNLEAWLHPGPRRIVFSSSGMRFAVDPSTWSWTLTPLHASESISEGRRWLNQLPRNRRVEVAVLPVPIVPDDLLSIGLR